MAANKDYPGTLRKLPGRDTWYLQIYIPKKGKKLLSTGETNYQAAITRGRELYEEQMLLNGPPEESPILSKAIVREAKRLEGQISEGSIDRVIDALSSFMDWFGDKPLGRVTTEILAKYQKASLKRKKMVNVKIKEGPEKGNWTRVPAKNGTTVKAVTINREILFICRMLRSEGYEVARPVPLPEDECHGRPFTADEMDKFFEACRAYPPEEPGRYLAFFSLLYCTGARPGELIPSDRKKDPALLKKEVDYENGTVTIRSIKRKRGERRSQAVLPVPPEVLELIKARAAKTEGPYVFPPMTINDIFLKIAKQAGLAQVDELGDRLMAHSFRHEFGTRLAEEGVNQTVIQNILRHRDPKMTELYQQRAMKVVKTDVSRLLGKGPRRPEPPPEREKKAA